jgi:ribA/ribD-fused uncharacterized protein
LLQDATMYSRAAVEAAQRSSVDLRFRFFWGHHGATVHAPTDAVFSQWFASRFEHEGIVYATAEQWMMAEKARLFGDEETRARILATDDPRLVKALGRKVRPFEQEKWLAARDAIVVAGNLHKFGQVPSLRGYLLSTGDDVLVEASPLDTIWGIGLGADNPRARQASEWRGENRLGFALMEVRAKLRKKS